ncbi:MAG: GH3 auxin-responsive promoter family protein, partial [Bacteroidota bacterium]
MAILHSIMSWVMKQRIHQIELFMKYPHEVQQDWFRKLITSAKDTEFGRMYDFSSIYSIHQFKERVPIRNYDNLKPFIDRVRSGEQNVLWNTPIKWFAKSSGTTADKSKFIPVSEESLEECHFKAGKDMLSIYCNNNPNSQLFSGKSLTVGGSHQISQINTDSFQGDLSAILMQNLPFWAQFVTTPNLSIALMNEWESKIEMMARATMYENVTSLAGVPSWTLLLMKHVLKLSHKKNLLEVWPNLELFFHGGVSFTPYREQFRELIPSAGMNYFETYNASEGFFGLQDQKNSDELLLMLDYGVYYEFLPMEDIHLENPKTLSLDEVKTDVNYALIISTNGGLWRYKIGDTIKFTSLSPYRIRISGRTRHFINAFGEELI